MPEALRANVSEYHIWLDKKIKEMVLKTTHAKLGGYPTLIWMHADGVRVISGVPSSGSMWDIIDSVVPRPEAASIEPRSVEMLKMQFQREPVTAKYYANADGVQAYALPDENAPVQLTYQKNEGGRAMAQVRLNGHTWIELTVWDGVDDKGVFVREQDVHQVNN